MNPFSTTDSRHRRGLQRVSRVGLRGAASFVLALGACVHSGGPEDVKPTSTTALRSPQPNAPQAPARQP